MDCAQFLKERHTNSWILLESFFQLSSKIQEFMWSKIQEFMWSKIQEFMWSKIQEFMWSKIQEFTWNIEVIVI